MAVDFGLVDKVLMNKPDLRDEQRSAAKPKQGLLLGKQRDSRRKPGGEDGI